MDFSGSLFLSSGVLPSAITYQHRHWIDLSHPCSCPQHYTCFPPPTNHIFSFAIPSWKRDIKSSRVFIQIFTSFPEVKDDNDHGVWERNVEYGNKGLVLLYSLHSVVSATGRYGKTVLFFFLLLVILGKWLKNAGESVRRRHKYRRGVSKRWSATIYYIYMKGEALLFRRH